MNHFPPIVAVAFAIPAFYFAWLLYWLGKEDKEYDRAVAHFSGVQLRTSWWCITAKICSGLFALIGCCFVVVFFIGLYTQ